MHTKGGPETIFEISRDLGGQWDLSTKQFEQCFVANDLSQLCRCPVEPTFFFGLLFGRTREVERRKRETAEKTILFMFCFLCRIAVLHIEYYSFYRELKDVHVKGVRQTLENQVQIEY